MEKTGPMNPDDPFNNLSKQLKHGIDTDKPNLSIGVFYSGGGRERKRETTRAEKNVKWLHREARLMMLYKK